ncbi:hypothetical protein ABEV74_04645 [Paenibacillus cisolokensis]|uniref:hypothetical protein n=1 Tax=Paenibacillus cisolokensis TaxID=1658519 RepID=UPI003D2B0D38
MDRFEQGLPDPQEKPVDPIGECEYDECLPPIYAGQKIWKRGNEWYCSCKCMARAMGAVTMTV